MLLAPSSAWLPIELSASLEARIGKVRNGAPDLYATAEQERETKRLALVIFALENLLNPRAHVDSVAHSLAS
jgi:hypothetical protein